MSEERLDRLERIVETGFSDIFQALNFLKNLQENNQSQIQALIESQRQSVEFQRSLSESVEIMANTVQIMANTVAQISEQISEMQSEIRGLQIENRRMIERFFEEEN